MAVRLKEVDAVMIGMGWTGAILARELTKAGLSVVGLERGQDRTHFGRVFRNLAVELALTGQQLFQSKPDPAGPGGAAEEKGRRLFASPNSR